MELYPITNLTTIAFAARELRQIIWDQMQTLMPNIVNMKTRYSIRFYLTNTYGKSIYLDNNATTRCDPRVVDGCCHIFGNLW